jgi:hypothetical protein
LVDAQGSGYTSPTWKQAAIKIDEGPRRYVQANGISHATTSWIDNVLEKLNRATANDILNGLEKILVATSSQNTL